MACERYVGSLARVAAGELAGLEIEEHLARCEACRTELRALNAALALVDAELGDRLALQPSPALRARIRQALAEERAHEVSRPRRFVWPLAAAAAVALFALAVAVIRREGRPAESSSAGSDRRTTVAESSPSASPWAASRAPDDAVHPSSDAVARDTRSPDMPTARAQAGVASIAPPPHPEEPEVLVPPGEAEALFRFALALRRRQVLPGSLLATADASAPLAEIAPIDVAPLDIAPLDSTTSGT